jgi:lauroyl/myristoyl acyltransferase
MPSAELRVRLRTSLWLRRPLPTPIAVRRATARGSALWERMPAERERALAAMQAVVGGTERFSELEQLARQHLIEERARETLFWQPWRRPAMDASSSARMRAALDTGRGVLLSTCHMGPYLLCMSAIAGFGRTSYSAAGAWLFEQPSPGYWGRRVARRRREASTRDERLVCSVNSFGLLLELLRGGEIVSVFFDIPGSHPTNLLGKPVMLVSGTGRLATQSDALVLPMRARRVGHRVWVDLGEPLDPRDFKSPDELHEALARVHEDWILELPATMEDPNRAGSWEGAASAERWGSPTVDQPALVPPTLNQPTTGQPGLGQPA